uniref:Uncharacterized protein n=1 Tax=Naja naja TaxID=35670 RepID=A0A8C6X962_NAJNA
MISDLVPVFLGSPPSMAVRIKCTYGSLSRSNGLLITSSVYLLPSFLSPVSKLQQRWELSS